MSTKERECPHCGKMSKGWRTALGSKPGEEKTVRCEHCMKRMEPEVAGGDLRKSAPAGDLNKQVQGDLEVATKIAEFSMQEMRKWEPDVKRQVSDWAKAAIPRFKTAFGED